MKRWDEHPSELCLRVLNYFHLHLFKVFKRLGIIAIYFYPLAVTLYESLLFFHLPYHIPKCAYLLVHL